MKIKPLSLLYATGGFLPLSLAAQYDTNLIGYWPFEGNLTETSGAHAAGTHDGTAVGTVNFGTGPMADFGQAVSFPAADAAAVPPVVAGGVRVDGTNATDTGTYVDTFDDGVSGAVSISFWASGLPGGWSPFVAKRGETGEGYQVRRRSGSANGTFTLRETEGVDDPQGAISISAGQPVWNHYVATWDGSTRKLYVNGVEDPGVTQTGDTAITGPGNAVNYWLTFGMRHNNADSATFQNFFTGEMDDVAIWNRALSSTEVFQLGLAPLADILLETDADGDGLFASQELTFGTLDTESDTDNDGVSDFDEFVKGGDGTIDDDFDMDGLTNLQETSGSANPFGPGDTTDWCAADSDGDGINDGDEVGSLNGFVTDPNNTDTDGDGFSDFAELAESSDPTDPSSVPPITTGLVGYWEFENDLVETSGVHAAGTHDAATTDMFPEVYGTGPTAIDDGVLFDFGSSLNTVADDNGTPVPYGVYVQGSNSTQSGYVDTFDAGIGNEFSVSIWAKGWPGNWSPFISKKGESNEGFQIRRRGNGANATFTLHQTAGAVDPTGTEGSANDQPLWRHYLGTWNGATGERKLYVDGVLAFTQTGDFETGDVGAATAYWLTFGGRHNSGDSVVTIQDQNNIFTNLFSGEIDDVAFWHRALKDTEAAQLASAPLSFVVTQIDTDQDGLFASQETAFGTSDTNPDTDGDGVGDLVEFNKGGNGTLDDDPDMDGLVNSQETSGSANPWVGGVNTGNPGGNSGDTPETTDWCVADSDLDGINDGDEISALNGFVTDPNNPDTDGDGFTDGDELLVGTDPIDDTDSPPINDTLPIIDDFEDNLIAIGTFSTITGTVSQNATGSVTGGTVEETGGCVVLGTRGYLYTSAQFDPEVVGGLEITGEMTGQAVDDIVSIITRGNPIPNNAYGEAVSGIQFLLNFRNGEIDIVARNGDHTIANSTGPVPFAFAVDVFYTFQVVDDGVGGLSLTVTDRDNPATTATVFAEVTADTSNVNHVIFYNREEGGRMSSLHEVSITADPTPVDPGGDEGIVVVDCFLDGNGFSVDVTGLAPTVNYVMKRSLLLDGSDWADVGAQFTGGTTNTFTDAAPVAKAFYQIFEVAAPE